MKCWNIGIGIYQAMLDHVNYVWLSGCMPDSLSESTEQSFFIYSFLFFFLLFILTRTHFCAHILTH